MTEYVTVRDLPKIVQTALESVGYGRKDIGIQTAPTVSLSGAGGDGKRDFVVLVNLATDDYKTEYGSWGGINAFNRTNAVDNDNRSYPLPRNGVIVKGSMGGGQPIYATLYVSDQMRDKVIAAGPAETLTEPELTALYAFKGYKSSYRKEFLARKRITDDLVASLVTRGYLSENKAGARQITTKGKNAVGNFTAY